MAHRSGHCRRANWRTSAGTEPESTPRARTKRWERGIALVSVLLFVALISVGLQRALVWVSFQMQREAEAELAFIGQEYMQAIRSFYLHPTGTRHELPRKLDDLLQDPRRLTISRHLRRIYTDPLTGHAQWGVVWGRLESAPYGLPDNAIRNGPPPEGIVGIYSLSARSPIDTRRAGKAVVSRYEDVPFLIPAQLSEVRHVVKKPALVEAAQSSISR